MKIHKYLVYNILIFGYLVGSSCLNYGFSGLSVPLFSFTRALPLTKTKALRFSFGLLYTQRTGASRAHALFIVLTRSAGAGCGGGVEREKPTRARPAHVPCTRSVRVEGAQKQNRHRHFSQIIV